MPSVERNGHGSSEQGAVPAVPGLVGRPTQVQPVLGHCTDGQRFAAAPAADHGAVGQRDHPGQRLDHHHIVPHHQPNGDVPELVAPGVPAPQRPPPRQPPRRKVVAVPDLAATGQSPRWQDDPRRIRRSSTEFGWRSVRRSDRLGMEAAVVLGQDRAGIAGPVRHRAAATLAAHDRKLPDHDREAGGVGGRHRHPRCQPHGGMSERSGIPPCRSAARRMFSRLARRVVTFPGWPGRS